jgi:tetratricopeptide (TPR) repeat protein
MPAGTNRYPIGARFFSFYFLVSADCHSGEARLRLGMHGRHPASGRGKLPARGSWLTLLGFALCLIFPLWIRAMDIDEARALYHSGQYHACLVEAEAGFKERPYSEQWRLLWVECLDMLGRYPEARQVITNALAQETTSVRLRWAARSVFRNCGEPLKGDQMIQEIVRLAASRSWAYRDAADMVAVGRAALLAGSDPKEVLDRFFGGAKKSDPSSRDAYLASGDLALDKHDYALAARTFQEGLKKLPKDPDLHYGLARAYAPSDPPRMLASIQSALNINSNHVACLLLLADHLIDAEDYSGAEKLLDHAFAVNPRHPEVWAYRAVIAHLRNQPQREQASREMGLKAWPANPGVPHLIGLKLSQKYRFAEGAALQREALGYETNYLPAKAQLAEDLLRLGQETDGWSLAEQVHQEDGYDVRAMNLVTLKDTMAGFTSLTNAHFVIRMSPREAAVYGTRVLDLLERARSNLCARYGLDLKEQVLVEVFPDQSDFAVRTFGLPENQGFLGVCFGRVITANSPASRPGQHFNWESMLWHEFCHVVTLQLTHNKMPRWLSEGISVYEEHQAQPGWGEQINPRYREMLLGDDFTPISKLSGAFLGPRSPLHLQFAYYQASLAVEFLAQRFGFEKLRAILRDLGTGAEINSAIATNTIPIEQLEKDYAAFARQRAAELAPGLDWEKPGPDLLRAREGDPAWADWARGRPTNFWVLTRHAEALVDDKKWAEAIPVLERIVQLYPGFTGSDGPYGHLAQAYRETGATNKELATLERWATRDDEALEAYQRLMELATARQDWPGVTQNANRYVAVNPLVPLPYRFLAKAGEAQGQWSAAVDAQRALLQLDPSNPAEVHYNLARLLHRTGDPAARRHVVQALEEAPRYRAALELLLKVNDEKPAPATNTATGKTGAKP